MSTHPMLYVEHGRGGRGPVCGKQVVRDAMPECIQILFGYWDGRMTFKFELWVNTLLTVNNFLSLRGDEGQAKS